MKKDNNGLQQWAVIAQEELRKQFRFQIFLSYHTPHEACGPCPFCKKELGDGGTDRFVVFEDGNFFCRYALRMGKNHKGWWLNAEQRPSSEEIAARKLREQQDKLKLASEMATCQDWQEYHNQVDKNLWLAAGLDEQAIDRWGLGYCKQAPCTEYETPSITIPVFKDQKLVDIRHRLLNPKEGEKYRSHKPGLPAQLFNADGMEEAETLCVVEGEKKAIVLEHNGFRAVGFPGLNNFNLVEESLLQNTRSSQVQKVLVIPDPGTQKLLAPSLRKLAKEGIKVGVVDLFEKPDDFILTYGVDSFRAALNYPRGF